MQNLTIVEASVNSLLVEDQICQGIKLQDGSEIRADSVIMTTGTFLGGRVHIGRESQEAGRFMRSGGKLIDDSKNKEILEPPSNEMSKCIKALGFPVGRMRTGTPPRIKYSSIDFSVMDAQLTDDPPSLFSYVNDFNEWKPTTEMIKCYITKTTKETHDVVLANLDNLPQLYNYEGKIV